VATFQPQAQTAGEAEGREEADAPSGSVEVPQQAFSSRSGGAEVGLRKHSTLSEEATVNQFKQVDVRLANRIPLTGKKAKLITEHPANSFAIVEEGEQLAYLEIKDPSAFWRLSKYMVVEVK
jgi:hypothetical protein